MLNLRSLRIAVLAAAFCCTFAGGAHRREPAPLTFVTTRGSGETMRLASNGDLTYDRALVATDCRALSPGIDGVSVGGALVEAAPVDKRAQVTIQVSPREAFVVWLHLGTQKLGTEAEQDAEARVAKALGYAEIKAKVRTAAAAKKDVSEEDFPAKRLPRLLARDDLEMLRKWVVANPPTSAMNATLTPLRQEWDEVLAGRNPY